MTSEHDVPKITKKILLAAGIISVFFLLVLLRPPHMLFKPDQAIYALVGSEILHGAVPYQDIWDNKGPILLGLNALLFGLFGNHPPLYDLFLTLWLVFTCWTLALVGRCLWGLSVGWPTFILFTVACAFPAGRELNGEIAGAPFVALGMYFALGALNGGAWKNYLGAGFFMGFSLLAKPVFGAETILVLLVLVITAGGFYKAFKAAGIYLLGIFCALLPVLLIFGAKGALDDFYRVYIESNLLYAGNLSTQKGLRDVIAFTETQLHPLVAFWGLALGGLAGLWGYSNTNRATKLLITGWLLAAIMGVSVGRLFPHYLVQLFLPAVVLGVWAVVQIIQGLSKPSARPLALAMGGLLLMSIGLPLISRTYNSLHGWTSLHEPESFEKNELVTAQYLKQHTSPEDTLFVVGMNAHLNLLTDLRPASRFIYTRFLLEAKDDTQHQQRWQTWREDMERNRPGYIIISNYNQLLDFEEGVILKQPDLIQYLHQYYQYETTIRDDTTQNQWNMLYRRK